MFCHFTSGTVNQIIKGQYKSPDGTQYPKAWLRRVQKDTPHTMVSMNVYPFEDQSKSGIGPYQNMGPTTDTLSAGIVTRTNIPVNKNVPRVKEMKLSEVTSRRKQVEIGGAYWDSGSNMYVVDTTHSSQGRLVHATVYCNESDNTSLKWSLILESTDALTWTDVRQVFQMPKFKDMAVSIGDHVNNCFNAEEIDHIIISALTDDMDVAIADEAAKRVVYDSYSSTDLSTEAVTARDDLDTAVAQTATETSAAFTAITTYDSTAAWPSNPVHPDNRPPVVVTPSTEVSSTETHDDDATPDVVVTPSTEVSST